MELFGVPKIYCPNVIDVDVDDDDGCGCHSLYINDAYDLFELIVTYIHG